MKTPSLQEFVARLGPVHPVTRNEKGSHEDVALSVARDRTGLNAIGAILALAQCGLSLAEAKRVIEAVLDDGVAKTKLAKVDGRDHLTDDLAKAGFRVQFLAPS